MTLWHKIRASLVLIGITLNTLVLAVPLFSLALIKLLIPVARIRIWLSIISVWVAETWIAINSLLIELISRPHWQVEGLDGLSKHKWYLVTSNHQTWADILVLQRVFNRRIPFLKFFLKQELIKVPVLGLAWWALDFPFMKRYSRQQIEKNPTLAGRDIEATRKACEKFRHIPVSIVNFAEGTRFRASRHQQQDSSFSHLLKPRAGGTAFVLDAMGDTIDTLVDVTLYYPNGPAELADLFANRIPEVHVHIRTLPIPDELKNGDYQNDPAYRENFQAWLNQLWEDKDALLEKLQQTASV